jgi:hypothetical protein
MAHRHSDAVSETQIQVSRRCGCRKNKKDNAPPSRPSCLECVEKHLGAAFVIASEIHDGYAYRLRLIGHLYEAEDESQAYQKLHENIRQARKQYQTDGSLPDWEWMAKLISETKNVS